MSDQRLFDCPAAGAPVYATSYEIERSFPDGCRVAGVDEVGRGAWAGPVTVCAVIVPPGFGPAPKGLTDSKLLSATRRASIYEELAGWVAGYGIGEASHEEVDAAGMTVALRRAAIRALEQLPLKPDMVVLDGAHDYIGRPWPVRCVVKADMRSVSVAAASVIAKEHRDRYMAALAFDGDARFAFAENAGYPSPAHQLALAELGPTPYHRLSWSYLDDLPKWRHLKRSRPDIGGQLTLL